MARASSITRRAVACETIYNVKTVTLKCIQGLATSADRQAHNNYEEKLKVLALQQAKLVALEVENKKTKEDLMVADKKILGARAVGYAEGLDEGKAKWLRSVEFLHHLTDASMKYFNYGFDSCQKQAEQLGFVGQLNKDSALKDAPELKGWESK
ncbi:hypothetical protein ACS0TY_015042 [Phlomoides rotata]